jgi:hypothetical protein
MKGFDKKIFTIATFVTGFLLLASFLAAFGEDEDTLGRDGDTLGRNIILVFLSKLFYVLRFPTHTLFWSTFSSAGAGVFLSGLIINCMFYGFLTERIYSVFRQEKVN